MPTRVLREGILTSERVNKLTEKGELFYRRLMSVVDDYGRYFAHPALIRSACYPLRVDMVSEANVKQMLIECLSAKLLSVYGDGKYIQLLDFRQQTRSKSKFPEPSKDELFIDCTSNGNQMCSETESESESETESKSRLTPKPTLDDCKEFCKSVGLPETDGEWFFYKCEGCDWKNNGKPIKDWKATIRAWKLAGHMASQKQLPNGHLANPPKVQKDPDIWPVDSRFTFTKPPQRSNWPGDENAFQTHLAEYQKWHHKRLADKQKPVTQKA